ncbi:MAG: acyl-CoA thioesterase [Clostridia bacterium]|nr:acyl-CoA thioesterase [Clostridia bacterium]
MENYVHKVNYYETDKMGITHHSNYIRWMEEARINYLEKNGLGYDKLEEQGIISPVIGLECEYKTPTTFNDCVEIIVSFEEYNGVTLTVKYTMTNQQTNAIVLQGKSKHCFTNSNGRPIILKRSFPLVDDKLKELIGK